VLPPWVERQTAADDEDRDNRMGCENEQQWRSHYARHRDQGIDHDKPRENAQNPHNDLVK